MECHWGHLMEMRAKEWFDGELMGSHQGCSMSSSWGIPHHCHSMAWCWDFSWGGFHGLALWVAHWDAIGISHGEIHGMHLWVAHGDPPMGIPWNANGTFHWWHPWHGFMGSSWGSP